MKVRKARKGKQLGRPAIYSKGDRAITRRRLESIKSGSEVTVIDVAQFHGRLRYLLEDDRLQTAWAGEGDLTAPLIGGMVGGAA